MIGFLHITLAFPGDILVVYALLGMVLYLYRNASLKKIMITGFVFIGLQIVIMCAVAFAVQMGMKFAPDDMLKESEKCTRQLLGQWQCIKVGVLEIMLF
ncbi:MAG: hypothetical protein JKX72_02845 [Robiginitomaculum sp.]|nr:hypothetical protein [Robiginitomaculum sp.]